MKSAILQSSATFLIVLISAIVFKDDKLNKNKVAAIIIGFTGIIVTNIGSDFDFNFKLTGEGFLFLAAFFSSIGHVYMRAKGNSTNAVVATCFQMIIGSILLILLGKLGMKSTLVWNVKGIMLLLYSGFLSATAFTLWYGVLKYNKAGEVSIYMLFIPIFGSILSATFIPGEKFTINIVIGLILVVVGIFVLNMKKE
ncbi:DMT family transporter [Miniphocaeibacter halophilus]|uniref:DMT family transporter n=2 Tax=Miniphocaeibacter halophilus TaxID=2931922 RepID=A0AC61MSE7_9FIRM|nr:DMT family transporter [Miniphocaeibacter halophilus]